MSEQNWDIIKNKYYDTYMEDIDEGCCDDIDKAIRQALRERMPKKNIFRGLRSPYKEQRAFDNGYDQAIDDITTSLGLKEGGE